MIETKGALAVLCMITDPSEKYYLVGRRSKKRKWHYKRWSSIGGAAEMNNFSEGMNEVLWDEINEEINEDIRLHDIKLIGVIGQTGAPWTNFIFTAHAENVNLAKIMKSNDEFLDNSLYWKRKSELLNLHDKQLFGDLKFLKHRNRKT